MRFVQDVFASTMHQLCGGNFRLDRDRSPDRGRRNSVAPRSLSPDLAGAIDAMMPTSASSQSSPGRDAKSTVNWRQIQKFAVR